MKTDRVHIFFVCSDTTPHICKYITIHYLLSTQPCLQAHLSTIQQTHTCDSGKRRRKEILASGSVAKAPTFWKGLSPNCSTVAALVHRDAQKTSKWKYINIKVFFVCSESINGIKQYIYCSPYGLPVVLAIQYKQSFLELLIHRLEPTMHIESQWFLKQCVQNSYTRHKPIFGKSIVNSNKYERYYGPGRRPLAYLLYYYAYGKSCLCINIHHYAPLLTRSCCSRPPRWMLHYTHCAGRILVKVQCQVLNR